MTTGSRGRSRISMKVRHEHFLIRWLLCSLCLDTFLLSHIPILNLSPFALRNVRNSELPVFFSRFAYKYISTHSFAYSCTNIYTRKQICTHLRNQTCTLPCAHTTHTHLIVQTVLSFFHTNEIKTTKITSQITESNRLELPAWAIQEGRSHDRYITSCETKYKGMYSTSSYCFMILYNLYIYILTIPDPLFFYSVSTHILILLYCTQSSTLCLCLCLAFPFFFLLRKQILRYNVKLTS